MSRETKNGQLSAKVRPLTCSCIFMSENMFSVIGQTHSLVVSARESLLSYCGVALKGEAAQRYS